MSTYRLTPRALKDLDQIADFSLARWGERQTEKYLSDMSARFGWLGQNQEAGRIRDEVGEGYRSFRQGSHLIFYIIENDVLAINAYFQRPTDRGRWRATPKHECVRVAALRQSRRSLRWQDHGAISPIPAV